MDAPLKRRTPRLDLLALVVLVVPALVAFPASGQEGDAPVQDIPLQDGGVQDGSVQDASVGPSWLERWLHNPQAETRRAREALEAGDQDEAVIHLETALRLAAESPVVRYNAGTGLLAAGSVPSGGSKGGRDSEGAEGLLQSVVIDEAATSEVGADASYNLGNARMRVEDYSRAIDAFKLALRHDPQKEDAKFNLELALQRLEEQQQENEPEEDDEEEEQQDQQQQEQQQQQQQQQEPPPSQDQQQEEEQEEGPLPQFRDLPDMTEEEAAAILEAIENMERERRRDQALENMKANASGKKDW